MTNKSPEDIETYKPRPTDRSEEEILDFCLLLFLTHNGIIYYIFFNPHNSTKKTLTTTNSIVRGQHHS
jgi:hypothetical protein